MQSGAVPYKTQRYSSVFEYFDRLDFVWICMCYISKRFEGHEE